MSTKAQLVAAANAARVLALALPADSVPPVEEPPPATLTLVRLSPANTGIEYGGYNFQFNVATIMAGGKLHHCWNGTWEFDLATGAAIKRTVTNADGSTPTSRPENCGMTWVPSLSLVYESQGAPVGPPRTYNPATLVYTVLPGATEGDVLLKFDAPRNRLISVGGYTPPFDVRVFPLPDGPWAPLATTNPPSATFDYAKCSMYRGGISSSGRVGFFGDNNVLKELEGGSQDWTTRPYTGVMPSVYTIFDYYEPLDAYFGWCGAAVIQGANTPAVRKFYMLRRSDWVCHELDVVFPAVTPPSARAMCQNILIADPVGERLVLMVGDGYVQLFTLDLRGLL